MTTAAPSTAVPDYLAQLRAQLADLPPGEVEDILDDVGVQLAESGDEVGRLGSPESYAAELRAAAGYPAAPVGTGGTAAALRPRAGLWLLAAACLLAVPVGALGVGSGSGTALLLATALLVVLPAAVGWVLVQGTVGLRALPESVALRRRRDAALAALPPAALELLAVLRPAWWAVRAAVAAALVVAAVEVRAGLPTVLLLGLVLVVPSAWVGLRARTSRAWRWAALPLDALAVGVGLALLGGTTVLAPVSAVDSTGYADGSVTDFASLPAYNVYPFDAAGDPLTGVYLFDQDGQPIRLYANPCYDGSYETTSGQEDGSNAYPLPNVVNDPQTGRCVTVPGVPFTALVPRASTTATPSSAPSPSSGAGSASSTPAAPTTAPATTAPAPTTTG